MLRSSLGGGDAEGPTTTYTQDLANKIKRYVDAELPLRALATRGNDGVKKKACDDLVTTFESNVGMLDDAFKKRWLEYGGEVVPALKLGSAAFKEYVDFAKRESTSRSAGTINERDLRVVSELSQSLQKYAMRISAYWEASDYEDYKHDKESARTRRYDMRGTSIDSDYIRKKYASIEDAKNAWEKVVTTLQSIRSDATRTRLAKFVDPSAVASSDENRALQSLQSDVVKATSSATASRSIEVERIQSDLENVSQKLDDLVAAARDKLAAEAAGSTAFDPRKVGFDDFLSYSEKLENDVRTKQPSALIQPDDVAVFRTKLALPYFNQRIGAALVMSVAEMRKRVSAWLKQAASGSSSSRSQDLAMRKSAVQQLDNMLALAETKLSYPSTQGPPSELRDLINRLQSRDISEAIDGGKTIKTTVPGDERSSSSSSGALAQMMSSSSSGGPPSAGAGGIPGIGFLYRTVDPIRVARYLEQIERFRDEANDSRADEFVATQANRLADTVLDLERQATAMTTAGIDDAGAGGAKSAGELSLRLRQLALAKVAAAKSFVRGVRSAAAAYATMHVRFVSERHGEAMRYMRYWDDLRAAAKDDSNRLEALGIDDAIKKAIEDHKDIAKDLVKGARKKLVEKIRSKVLESQRDSLGTAGQPRLDDAQQADVDKQLDKLSVWLVDRAEAVEETYLRGAPTMLESVTEPTTMMLYGLKAVRLACASAALNVASGTFETMYVRNVYTLDAPPPNPAILVALAIGLDAALSAIVLLVLYTTMRVFKTAENDFPIDGSLLWAWVHDYVAATLAIGALSLVVGEVIRSKKYFRYKYEGERGIRAMREMMWYIYCVLLPIPFYRLLG